VRDDLYVKAAACGSQRVGLITVETARFYIRIAGQRWRSEWKRSGKGRKKWHSGLDTMEKG